MVHLHPHVDVRNSWHLSIIVILLPSIQSWNWDTLAWIDKIYATSDSWFKNIIYIFFCDFFFFGGVEAKSMFKLKPNPTGLTLHTYLVDYSRNKKNKAAFLISLQQYSSAMDFLRLAFHSTTWNWILDLLVYITD